MSLKDSYAAFKNTVILGNHWKYIRIENNLKNVFHSYLFKNVNGRADFSSHFSSL